MNSPDDDKRQNTAGKVWKLSALSLAALSAVGGVLSLLKPPDRENYPDFNFGKDEASEDPSRGAPVLIGAAGSRKRLPDAKEEISEPKGPTPAERLDEEMKRLLRPMDDAITSAVQKSRPSLKSMHNQLRELKRSLIKFDRSWSRLGDVIYSRSNDEEIKSAKTFTDWRDGIERAYKAANDAFFYDQAWGVDKLRQIAVFEADWLRTARPFQNGDLPDRLILEFHSLVKPARRGLNTLSHLRIQDSTLELLAGAHAAGVHPLRDPFRGHVILTENLDSPASSGVREAFKRVAKELEGVVGED